MPPPVINLQYKKYYPPNPPVVVGTLEYDAPAIISNIPNWLTVYPWPSNSITLHIKPLVANTMPPGIYTQTIFLRGTISSLSAGTSYLISLEITDSVLLTISPTVMNFNYAIGGTPPASKALIIESETNWAVTTPQSWITLSVASGVNSGTSNIGVDVTGLAIGNYEGTVTVDDGLFQKIVTVYLSITGIETPVDYLTINSTSLEFVETLAVTPTQQRSVSIDATSSWTTAIDQTWLLLDIENANAGVTNIIVTVDSVALAVGTYFASIVFSTATMVKTLYVVLRITEVTTSGIVSGNLYFADDRNVLSVSNTNPNTFSLIDFIANNLSEILTYPKKAPFFRGQASIFIGTETENILQGNSVTNNFLTRVLSPITPISYDFTVFDKNVFNNTTVERQAFTNVKFLNGKTPVITDRLTYLPSQITTTKDAILALSFISETPPETIDVTGDITQTIPVSVASNTVYTALINLSDLALAVGNTITLSVGGQSVQVTIKDREAEHTLFAFENEWQCPEYIMFTGALKITSGKGWKTTKVENNGGVHTKILEAKHPITFTVNTGFLYSQEEIDWVDKMFDNKKFYVFIQGEKIEVIPSTSKLIPYQTRRYYASFLLTFKKAIV